MGKTEQEQLMDRLSKLTKYNRGYREESQKLLEKRREIVRELSKNIGSNIETSQQPRHNKDAVRFS